MCGIAGFAGFFDDGLVARMTSALTHRGPDSGGVAEFPGARMAVGIRRLAVVDLATGDQPMVSADGCVHLVMNGEIYNYAPLREQFVKDGYPFRTRSDTEVVLAAYLAWGDQAWARLDGMFAIAIVDLRAEPALVLVRDRVGIKPLYLIDSGGRLAFASELKALLAWSGWSPDIDVRAIRDYLALRYVPGPGSLFRDVQKCPAAHMLVHRKGRTTLTRWWELPRQGRRPDLDAGGAAAHVGQALRAAVRSHMVADVPVGAFLSGGVDSGILVALMREASSAPIHTFSIGFQGFAPEDQAGAAATARRLGTTHHAIECRPEDMAALPDIAWSLDEPVGDAIVVPMAVLSQAARRHVTVVLSGEGADEIFGGYLFHRRLVQLATLRRALPPAVWRAAARIARYTPTALLAKGFQYPGVLGEQGRLKIAGLLETVATGSLLDLYRRSVSLFDDTDLRALAASPALAATMASSVGPSLDHTQSAGMSALQQLLSAQFADWLPDDILMKADKMSMAHSLELRVPFMDERVIQAAADLPDRRKLTRTANKAALRDFARPYLPPSITAGPKRAFYAPLESYVLTNPLRDIFRAMLDPERLRKRGLLEPDAVRRLGVNVGPAGFLALKRQFSIVMLELWFERFAPEASWS